MGKIAISEFKAKCLAVIDEVNKTKKSVIITRRGKPIAELIPAAAKVGMVGLNERYV